jgi:hypothetical protein
MDWQKTENLNARSITAWNKPMKKHSSQPPRRADWLLAACLIAAAGLATAQEGVIREYQVKAVLLFNFTGYTTWPGEFQDGLHLCVFGADPFHEEFDLVVENENSKGQSIRVARFSDPAQMQNCQILYISQSEKSRYAELLKSIQSQPILTVSDSPEFISSGGMVEFYSQDTEIRFAVNMDALQAAGLKISANLLQLAKIVRRAN